MQNHYHLCCDRCQQWDVNLSAPTKRRCRKLSKEHGWLALYEQGRLIDVCPDCVTLPELVSRS